MVGRRWSVLLLVGALAAASVMGAAAAPAFRFDRNIKVGVVDTYSGPPAVFGNDALNGFRLALQEINRDGVHGARIEFVTRDEKFSPEIGLSMARELVLQERVDVLVGTINSATALAISAFAREQRVPFIVWISKSEAITGARGHRVRVQHGGEHRHGGKGAGRSHGPARVHPVLAGGGGLRVRTRHHQLLLAVHEARQARVHPGGADVVADR